jgi:hypothetical protein
MRAPHIQHTARSASSSAASCACLSCSARARSADTCLQTSSIMCVAFTCCVYASFPDVVHPHRMSAGCCGQVKTSARSSSCSLQQILSKELDCITWFCCNCCCYCLCKRLANRSSEERGVVGCSHDWLSCGQCSATAPAPSSDLRHLLAQNACDFCSTHIYSDRKA